MADIITNFLDLQTILISEIIGGLLLSIIVLSLLTVIISKNYGIPFSTTFVLLIMLSGILVGSITSPLTAGFFYIMMMLAGGTFFFINARFLRRG